VSTTETSESKERRARQKGFMRAVDRAGLGLIYALVVAVIPLSAVGLWTRSVV